MVSTLDIDIFDVTIWQDFSQTKFLKTDRLTYTKKHRINTKLTKARLQTTLIENDWKSIFDKKKTDLLLASNWEHFFHKISDWIQLLSWFLVNIWENDCQNVHGSDLPQTFGN